MKTLPNEIWEFIKSWEGGDKFTDHPLDKGGPTKYGISQVYNPDVDVKFLTEEQAVKIYVDRYFSPSNCPLIPEYMRLMQVNCAVNCGVNTAVRTLQKTVGVKADGKFGPKTQAAVDKYSSTKQVFVGWYATWQLMYYFNIVQRSRSQSKWLKGWLRRTLSAVYTTAVLYDKR